MQKMDKDTVTRATSSYDSNITKTPRYRKAERQLEKEMEEDRWKEIEMEKEQRRLVEERLEFETQRRKFMMGKGQEEKRMKEPGPVRIDPFADEEFYKPKYAGTKIKYKYT